MGGTAIAPELVAPRRLGDAALGTAAVGAAAVAARAASVSVPCPFLAITGLPCPGCGMTRLADTGLHGDVLGAVSTDPLGTLVLAAIAALALLGLAVRAGVAVPLPAAATRGVPLALAGALLARWVTTLTGMVSFTG